MLFLFSWNRRRKRKNSSSSSSNNITSFSILPGIVSLLLDFMLTTITVIQPSSAFFLAYYHHGKYIHNTGNNNNNNSNKNNHYQHCSYPDSSTSTSQQLDCTPPSYPFCARVTSPLLSILWIQNKQQQKQKQQNQNQKKQQYPHRITQWNYLIQQFFHLKPQFVMKKIQQLQKPQQQQQQQQQQLHLQKSGVTLSNKKSSLPVDLHPPPDSSNTPIRSSPTTTGYSTQQMKKTTRSGKIIQWRLSLSSNNELIPYHDEEDIEFNQDTTTTTTTATSAVAATISKDYFKMKKKNESLLVRQQHPHQRKHRIGLLLVPQWLRKQAFVHRIQRIYSEFMNRRRDRSTRRKRRKNKNKKNHPVEIDYNIAPLDNIFVDDDDIIVINNDNNNILNNDVTVINPLDPMESSCSFIDNDRVGFCEQHQYRSGVVEIPAPESVVETAVTTATATENSTTATASTTTTPNVDSSATTVVDLSGEWDLIVTDEFKKSYDTYLRKLGQPLFIRSIALSIIGYTSEEIIQSENGNKLFLRTINAKGVWERTFIVTSTSTSSTMLISSREQQELPTNTTSNGQRFTVLTADNEVVESEAWWEGNGTIHRSWLRGSKRYIGGGDFESKRYLLFLDDIDNMNQQQQQQQQHNNNNDNNTLKESKKQEILICETTFHPNDPTREKAQIRWQFRSKQKGRI